MGLEFITIVQEVNTRDSGYMTKNMDMELFNMETGISMKEAGETDSDTDKAFTSTQMAIFTRDSGCLITNRGMVSQKWLLEIDIRVSGLQAKRTEQVFLVIIKGKYIFANGDIYEGEFENGNRQGQGMYTWTD